MQSDYLYGCYDCEWWDNGSEPDFGTCPSCGQPKVVWNQTDAEYPTNHEAELEASVASHLSNSAANIATT